MDSIFALGLLKIISHMIFIFISFWALKALRIEKWIRKNHESEARILYFFLAMALGWAVSSFFLDFLETSRNLSLLLTN